jgi:uncharacterized protein YbaR (Trm112 family)
MFGSLRLYKREPPCKCNRCGLEYKIEDLVCPYCKGKTNAEIIRDVHFPHSEQIEETTKLGRYFIYITIILGCLFLLLF